MGILFATILLGLAMLVFTTARTLRETYQDRKVLRENWPLAHQPELRICATLLIHVAIQREWMTLATHALAVSALSVGYIGLPIEQLVMVRTIALIAIVFLLGATSLIHYRSLACVARDLQDVKNLGNTEELKP